MDTSRFFKSYCRSPLGIASFFLALGAGACSILLGLSPPSALLLGLGTLAAVFTLSLAFGFGPRAAVTESERGEAEKARSRLAEAAAARKRLSALRLPEGEVASARDLVVLESGRLVDECSGAGVYDPEAVQAVLDCAALVDAWLREEDESSTERRFSMPDAHPFPEAAARTAALLRDKAALIAKRREEATGEIPGSDRIAIEEELK
jgi:hypothetical protein